MNLKQRVETLEQRGDALSKPVRMMTDAELENVIRASLKDVKPEEWIALRNESEPAIFEIYERLRPH